MTVLVMKSTDSGATTLSGTTGELIRLLDRCLIVNHVFGTSDDVGFTDQSTEARLEGGTAFNLLLTNVTAARLYIGMTTPFPKAKFDLATLGVGGTYVWEYWNGTAWTTLAVTDGTTGFTVDGTVSWTIPGTWATTAVNAVTQYWVRVRASVIPTTNPTINFLTVTGWTKAFTGTNLAAYRQGTPSNGFFLRVDDTGTGATPTSDARDARVTGYEAMTDVNTGTNPFPTIAQSPSTTFPLLLWSKSGAVSATVRPWIIAATEKLFYMFVNSNSDAASVSSNIQAFGDIKSYKTGDAYHTIHIASDITTAATPANSNMQILGNASAGATGHFMARSYTQLGGSIVVNKISDAGKQGAMTTNMGGTGGLTFPNPVDGGLYLGVVFVSELITVIRGQLPGIWSPLHNQPLAHLDTFTGTGTLAGKTFMALRLRTSSEAFIETSDTWDV